MGTFAVLVNRVAGHRALGALWWAIAAVWVANGVWCKVLSQVPRHAQIVARVVGNEVAPSLTVAIGLAEVTMAAWVLSGRSRTLCAVTQIAVVMAMNVIEQVIAADLLLWGPFNLLWATLFCVVVGATALLSARATTSSSSGSR
jgi:hypothetical protein